MSKTCRTCEHARQVGDKSRVDLVGCALLARGNIGRNHISDGKLFGGFIYVGLSPAQPSDGTFGQGHMVNGFHIVNATASCKYYSEETRIFWQEGEEQPSD